MTTHAKTKQSAVLHKGPSLKSEIRDKLEPDYPLIVLGYQYVRDEAVELAHVKALKKGPRDEVQYGYIRASLVVEEPMQVVPKPAPPPNVDERPNWKALIIGALVIIAVGAAVLLYH